MAQYDKRTLKSDKMEVTLWSPDRFEIVESALRTHAAAMSDKSKEIGNRRLDEQDYFLRQVLLQLENMYMDSADLTRKLLDELQQTGVLVVRSDDATVEDLLRIRDELTIRK